MKKSIKKLIKMFCVFFKIGAFTFGGGYAMIPLIQKEVSENRGWISGEDIFEIIAISESTPGPIAINAATFVGYKIMGFWGALSATFGVVLPSFLIIFLISYVIEKFQSIKVVKYAFYGIRAGVLALIVKALLSMYKQAPKGIFSYIIMGLSFVMVALFKINVLYVIIGCAILGIIIYFAVRREAIK